MIDLVGIGSLLTGAGTLIAAVNIRRQLKMTNGTRVGQAVEETYRMAVQAEPHHHVIPLADPDATSTEPDHD